MNFSEVDLILKLHFEDSQPLLVDVGAHRGLFSEKFWLRGWSIVAFEPERRNREAFDERFGHLPRVTCIPKAVYLKSGERMPFYVSDEHFGIHSLGKFHESHRMAYEVETVRLDDALRALEVRNVTVLKIDVEGADFLALQSFDFDQWHPSVVMIEFMDDRSQQLFNYTHHDVSAYMAEKGYVTYVSEWARFDEYAKESDTFSGHKWIRCARYPSDHDPAWGNLIFVPSSRSNTFEKKLRRYRLVSPIVTSVRSLVAALPGARPLYHGLRKVAQR